jgi:hypothetical protein
MDYNKENIDLEFGLLVYFIILSCLVFILFFNLELHLFSSITISMILSLLILLFLIPPSAESLNQIDSSTSLYFLIIIVTFLIFIFYTFFSAFNDKRKNNNYFKY